jgi:hypothetical protein
MPRGKSIPQPVGEAAAEAAREQEGEERDAQSVDGLAEIELQLQEGRDLDGHVSVAEAREEQQQTPGAPQVRQLAGACHHQPEQRGDGHDQGEHAHGDRQRDERVPGQERHQLAPLERLAKVRPVEGVVKGNVVGGGPDAEGQRVSGPLQVVRLYDAAIQPRRLLGSGAPGIEGDEAQVAAQICEATPFGVAERALARDDVNQVVVRHHEAVNPRDQYVVAEVGAGKALFESHAQTREGLDGRDVGNAAG